MLSKMAGKLFQLNLEKNLHLFFSKYFTTSSRHPVLICQRVHFPSIENANPIYHHSIAKALGEALL